MENTIFYPVVALFTLTMLVAIFLIGVIGYSIINKKVKLKYFRVYSESFEAPEFLTRTRRNFNNLFEVPVIFYTLCAFIGILKLNDPMLLNLAWAYVIFRSLHSIIHIGYNHPTHRLVAFALSCLCLVGMTIKMVMLG